MTVLLPWFAAAWAQQGNIVCENSPAYLQGVQADESSGTLWATNPHSNPISVTLLMSGTYTLWIPYFNEIGRPEGGKYKTITEHDNDSQSMIGSKRYKEDGRALLVLYSSSVIDETEPIGKELLRQAIYHEHSVTKSSDTCLHPAGPGIWTISYRW